MRTIAQSILSDQRRNPGTPLDIAAYKAALPKPPPQGIKADNPGALLATARLYQRMVFAQPNAPEAARWAWLAEWHYLRSAGTVVAHQRKLQVKLVDLTAGDVILPGFFQDDPRHPAYEILDIEPNRQPVVWRLARQRNIITGEITAVNMTDYTMTEWGYSVIAGPKIEAIVKGHPYARYKFHPARADVMRWIGNPALREKDSRSQE